MRSKNEITDQMIDMNREHEQRRMSDFDFQTLNKALEIELMADIRDQLARIAELMRDVSSAAQIYQENNPV